MEEKRGVCTGGVSSCGGSDSRLVIRLAVVPYMLLMVAIWHDAAVLSSAQIQAVCASHQRTHMLFSLRAWRRYTQVTRCARDYRCNNNRSNRIVKPMFQCWRRSTVRTSTPCLWPDSHARSFVSAQVNHSMRVVLAQWLELTRHRVEPVVSHFLEVYARSRLGVVVCIGP